MSGAAHQGPYANPGTPNAPWGPGSGWGTPYPAYWHWRTFKPLLVAAMVLGFIFWWPIGLAFLLLMAMGKHMMCWSYGGPPWQQNGAWPGRGTPPWANWKSWCCGSGNGRAQQRSSGNRAFDEYRSETLNRLEEEQREFAAFLDRLRFAKDKAEFDQFMAERRQPRAPQEEPPVPQ